MTGKKRISKAQIFRHIIQILFFIMLPGLYATAFAGIKTVYQELLQNTFNFVEDFPAILGAISLLPITLILGRFFCGWMCAFGALGDWIYALSRKVFKIKFQIKENTDRKLKIIKYVLLVLLFIFLWNIESEFLNSANPWNAFGILAVVTDIPDFAYAFEYFTIGTIILILIMVGSLFIERFFCRYLCPLGAVFSILSRLSLVKISKPGDECGSCKLCTKKCSMGIPLYKYDKVSSGECIQCLKCVSACPRKNTNVAMLGNELNPAFAGAIAVTAMVGIYYTGNVVAQAASLNSDSSNYTISAETESGQYEDGTYEGTGTGFRGATTKVSVTVEDGYITDIETISHGDDAPYYNQAFATVTSEIIDSQSTDVDAVSGATYSSNGIMEAVEDALNNAGNSYTNDSEEEIVTEAETETVVTYQGETTTDVEETTQSVSESNSSYADGTYTGSGTGFHRAVTTLEVTVSGGLITDIEIISYGDDAPYFNRAYNTVTSEIISSQSTDVDAVSGATYSSVGIMDAVEDALSQAK